MCLFFIAMIYVIVSSSNIIDYVSDVVLYFVGLCT
jgi:hypothetical protein